MSKFSDLIQKKHEMLKVTMKVDPAACKNGEITHFKEYVGFVLAEKEFEKTYEKLLKQYTLQNEGFFDTVGGALRAVGRKLKDDIVKPFQEANPFKGYGDKPIDKTESGQIITAIESEWLDVNKKLFFNTSKYGEHEKTFEEINNEYSSSKPNKKQTNKKQANENYSYNNLADYILEKINISPNPRLQTKASEQVPQKTAKQVPQLRSSQTQPKQAQKSNKPSQNTRFNPKAKRKVIKQQPEPKETDYSSIIRKGIARTDLNSQISIRDKQNVYLPVIEKKIKEENNKRKEMREDALKIKSQDVWKLLVQKVENYFKASRDSTNVSKKILWAYILAQPEQRIVLTY